MNKFLKCLMPAIALTVAGCSDEFKNEQPNPPIAFEGDEVVFVVGSQDPVSRTTYAEEWAEKENQQIYWGNYLTTNAQENIRVFCRQSAHGTAATYLLSANETDPSNVALSISKVAEDEALQWGDKTVNHDFYAFYPAEKCSNDFIRTDGAVISGTVDTQQSPNYYRAKFGNSTEFESKTLKEIAENSTEGADQQTTIYAMPDMESAIMTAKYTATPADWGKTVPLGFDVIADVLDITVNGPITPNTLGGNAASGLERKNITINSILIQSSSIDQKLTGDFTIDMATGTVTPSQDANNQLVVYLADSEGLHPTLHVRSGAPAEGKAPVVDKLRARVFIMPGQVKNLSDLTITIGTNCGNYVQKLDSHDMVSGAIHPIKLKYFQQRGTTLEYSKWIGQLDENIYLSELSIPGTWHSSNENSQGAAAKDLAQQYAKGIRAFEVHTTNGTDLYNDYHFETAQILTSTNAKYFTTPSSTLIKQSNRSYSGGAFSPATSATGQSGSTRQVTATDVTVSITAAKTASYDADYALRLYRAARGVTTGNSLSDAIMELVPNMNSTGFMVVEMGQKAATAVSGIPVKQVVTDGMTASISGITLTGTQNYSTRQGNFITGYTYSFDAPTFDNVNWVTATYNGKEINLDDLYTLIADNAWSGGSETTTYTTKSVSAAQAWVVAVQSFLRRLQERDFTTKDGKTNKILYTGRITPETTIADVKGHVIVKINTNAPNEADNESGWIGNQIPALFSRWVGDSGKEPRTINLNWGSPINPTPLNQGSTDLHWCYTELDDIGSDISGRKAAIDAFAKVSAQNYVDGLHRTFYECAIGGFMNGADNAANYLAAAKELNPYLLKVLQDPTRPAAPFGFVFMSYAIPPTAEDAELLKSDELISTIINNNVAFLLNRKGGTSTQTNAADNTNSSFNANNGNPLK